MKTSSIAVVLYSFLTCIRLAIAAEPENRQSVSAVVGEGRVKFAAYDIVYGPNERAKDTFQINVSGPVPSFFLELGQSFRAGNCKFTLRRFEQKKRRNPAGGEEDVSELTVVNDETNEPIVLTLGKPKEVAAGPIPKK